MAGIFGIGGDGLAVTPYDLWLGSRGAKELPGLVGAAGTAFTTATGCAPVVAHAPNMLWWAHEHPDIYAEISCRSAIELIADGRVPAASPIGARSDLSSAVDAFALAGSGQVMKAVIEP